MIVWAGVALSVVGLAGLIGCIVTVWRARRANLPDDAMRAHLQKVVAWNLAFLLTSALGLGCVAVGVILS
ncbi:MAG: hypothetical protein AAGG09_15775 [Pseudomonadota bacterium]